MKIRGYFKKVLCTKKNIRKLCSFTSVVEEVGAENWNYLLFDLINLKENKPIVLVAVTAQNYLFWNIEAVVRTATQH